MQLNINLAKINIEHRADGVRRHYAVQRHLLSPELNNQLFNVWRAGVGQQLTFEVWDEDNQEAVTVRFTNEVFTAEGPVLLEEVL